MSPEGNETPPEGDLVSFYPGEDPRAPVEEIEVQWDGFMAREELLAAEPEVMDLGDAVIAAINHRRGRR